MKKLALCSALLLGLGIAAPKAHATALDVTYNLSGALTVAGALPAGNLTGTVTVRYTAPGLTAFISGPTGNPIHGPVHVQGGGLTAAINIDSLPSLVPGMTGTLVGAINPSGIGSLASPGNLFISSATGTIFGPLHCMANATHCGSLSPPMVPSVPLPVSMPFHFLLNAPTVTSGGILLPTFIASPMTVASMAGLPITATLTMSEVGRHVVPEPTSFSLVGLGLLGLAGGVSWRARRARRS
jgi:hypothetical protein